MVLRNLIGKTSNEEIIAKHELCMNLVKIIITDIETYVTESRPNLITNLSIPESCRKRISIYENSVIQ